ncbi:MAG TPA: ABC transporter ATP-binding protein [Acidocella sp.]|jgi:branched-chain amino acid transport system ATP-binding protein|uniref:ABC transporter ATP-binding protein n=1 Tax=Acidocella sp. TaxID=50710 RepID=UPI002C10110D|nr:ABC transporter ATP-binding protein [Acidocella sp.]HVE22760.1 ABC transporter ATP-binding protein [Acidocella sp.]
MLKVHNIQANYGAVCALHDISLDVMPGEIIVLLGMNGAGKSTTLKAISGLIHPARGSIIFQDKPIDRMSPEQVVRMGIAHVPEGRHVFPGLTVRENLIMGTSNRRVSHRETEQDIERILHIFPDLKRLYTQMGWSLSGGQQQMLAIGRGLMARPQLLMLDEPSLGLAPVVVKQMFRTIEELNREGMTILLVEQNVNLSLRIAHRAYLLETGRIIRTDRSANLLQDNSFKSALLGAGHGVA